MPTFAQPAKKNTVSACGNKASRDVYSSLLGEARIALVSRSAVPQQDKKVIPQNVFFSLVLHLNT
jgi:hypothetical protein